MMTTLRTSAVVAIFAVAYGGRVSEDDASAQVWANEAAQAVEDSEAEMRRILGESAAEAHPHEEPVSAKMGHWTSEEEAFISQPDLVKAHGAVTWSMVGQFVVFSLAVASAAFMMLSKVGLVDERAAQSDAAVSTQQVFLSAQRQAKDQKQTEADAAAQQGEQQ
eukprot:TRINITY_DN113070_c0_g1_i1.p2 TRINITY_DN113070_c0_g1~~TRINITY_DN113070_c0_g1_i1.p2  ORF type:complete len:164 (-),score=53.49 TRINITY_DN113070_c0_g1_i1:108-599(-)